MKPTAAPMIQAPSDHVLAELQRRIELEEFDGPVFMWDPVTLVCVTVVARYGVITDWQIDPARTREEADAVRDRQLQAATMAAMVIASALPPEVRADLDEHIAKALGRSTAH